MKKLVFLSLLSLVSGAGIVAAQNGQEATAGAPSVEDGAKRDCGGRHGDHAERRARFLKEADSNGDGTVSDAEKEAFFEAKAKERFEQHDTNKDGVLSKDELGRMPEGLFAKLDTNSDGGLSLDEMKAMKGHHGKHRGHHGKPHGKRGQRPEQSETAI